MNEQAASIPKIPCSGSQIQDGTCQNLSQWAAVDAARDAAAAANATVDLGVAGLVVGALTLLAAFFAAYQAKRGADAAVRDARSNEREAKALAADRQLQLNAQARLHGAKIRLSAPRIRFISANSVSLKWNMSNIGELPASLFDVQIGLQIRLDSNDEILIDQVNVDLGNVTTIIPLQDRQFESTYEIQITNPDMAASVTWFETRLNLWINWSDPFQLRRFEKWEAVGTNLVGTMEQQGAFNMLWEEVYRD